jgi:hypothetical protein
MTTGYDDEPERVEAIRQATDIIRV